MTRQSLVDTIADQTRRALWEVKNVIDAAPHPLWNKAYCGMPLWKHIYHMLHSLDQWYVNPRNFTEPSIHEENLNNLDIGSEKQLSRNELNAYYGQIKSKLISYLAGLTDELLETNPPNCEYSRFTLILAQFRHLHTHMGMVMGFVVADTGLWPRVIGLETPIPQEGGSLYF